mgnify:CR=1 FL=1
MKRLINNVFLSFIALVLLLTCVGCNGLFWGCTIEEKLVPHMPFQIQSDKMEYEYGEVIEIEFLFSRDINGFCRKDGNTYCVKIYESPYYEIIGDSEVYTDGSEITEYILGENKNYLFWYRAVFKIKVNEPFEGNVYPKIAVKCVDDDWLDEATKLFAYQDTGFGDSVYNTDDPEYPYMVLKDFYGFTADSEGIKFLDEYFTI